MAWKDTLLPASFRGVTFEVLRTRDHRDKAVVEHEFPYRDGGEVDDMGLKGRRVSMTAVLWGAAYEAALQKLIKALEERGPGDLVHPVFGPVKAQLVSFDIPHEGERPNYAEVALEFVVAGTDNPFFSRGWPKADAKAETARSGAAGVLAEAVAKAKNPMAMARAGLRSIAELKGQAGSVITSGANILTAPAGFAADVASLVTGIVDLRSFSGSSLLPDFQAVFAALTTAILLPDSGGRSSSGSAGSSDYAAAFPVSEGQELDQVKAHVEAERALGVAEAAQLVLESEAVTPTLSPAEIEGVAAQAREVLQASVEAYRTQYPVEQARAVTEPLKDTALAVQAAAAAVIEARPPLVSHTVAGRTCPRLLAHQLYSDHTRASEIARLNALADPNFLTPGEVLRVYAS